MRTFFYSLLFLPFLGQAHPSVPARAETNNDISGDYKGYIDLSSIKLKVVVHLREDDRKLSGTIDIPEQNAKNMPLDKVKLNQGELSFGLPDVPGNANFTGKWKPAVDSIRGTFSQNGMSFPMHLKKENATATDQPKLSQFAKVQKIEAYIDSVLRKDRMAGCAVGVIKDGEIILNKGFGYRDVENKVKCDAQTLFAIGSCSKAFTAALLASLRDENKFDWEKPIKQYVPYFGMKDKFADEQINGVDICTHRSGLPRHDLIWYRSTLSRRELVERIKYMEPNKPFRTTWQYNNYMFLTAGVVAEEITGEKWEDLVQKRFFDRLGMKQSKIHFEDFMASTNKAIGYKEEKKQMVKTAYANIDAVGPAGSIVSTSTDMIEWMRMFLNKGKKGEEQVISAAQVNYLLSPKMVMEEENNEFKQRSYALGWMVAQYKGKTIVEHGGNIDGFSADVTMLPEENMGIVVLSNKDGSSVPSLVSMYIADRLLDFEEYDWYEEKMGKIKRMAEEMAEKQMAAEKNRSKTKDTPAKKNPAKKGPLHDLKDYAGEYKDAAYGTLKIVFEGGQLSAIYNGMNMKMQHDMYETFAASFEGQEMKMVFFTNVPGKVEWVQMQMDVLTKPVSFIKAIPDYLNDKVYISKITGHYDFGGIDLELKMDGADLWAKLSDGQAFVLEPSGDNLFKIQKVEGYNMEPVFDEKGNCIKVISHQPNGDFEAKRK